MPDTSPLLALPYIQPAQAQKHVTHNEALRLLDMVVQLSVRERSLTTPPPAPQNGDCYLVAAGGTGIWAGWDMDLACFLEGLWVRLSPRPGWRAWVQGEAGLFVWTGADWVGVGRSENISDAVFSLVHSIDATRKAQLSLSRIGTGQTEVYTLPALGTDLAGLGGAQTFTGAKTFSGNFTASGAVATLGTAAGTATYGVGTGATTTGTTKTLNLGTGGAAGSNTVINIGSANADAGGTTVVNTPTVTFANEVTQVSMPQAALTAGHVGLGGAVSDATNRLSINTPALLFNHAGAGVEATLNKSTALQDAALAFKIGFSARALLGLLGNDDLAIKVSPDGSSFIEAMTIASDSGTVRLMAALHLADGTAAVPAAGFASDPDTGVFHPAQDQIGFAVGGVQRVLLTPTALQVDGEVTGTAVQASATDTTAGRLMRADWGFSRGNLLGSVNQSEGVPTGAVIERGSNVNGAYVRFADGTMRCTIAALPVANASTADGSLFRSATITWAFPSPFIAAPVVTGAVDNIDAWASTGAPTTTDCALRVKSSVSKTAALNLRAVAHGRWF